MKTGFKNELKNSGPKKFKNPWDFTQPMYDERSSSFIEAGTARGVGKRNPVGHSGPTKMRVDTLPYGRVDTLRTYEIPNKELDSQ